MSYGLIINSFDSKVFNFFIICFVFSWTKIRRITSFFYEFRYEYADCILVFKLFRGVYITGRVCVSKIFYQCRKYETYMTLVDQNICTYIDHQDRSIDSHTNVYICLNSIFILQLFNTYFYALDTHFFMNWIFNPTISHKNDTHTYL